MLTMCHIIKTKYLFTFIFLLTFGCDLDIVDSDYTISIFQINANITVRSNQDDGWEIAGAMVKMNWKIGDYISETDSAETNNLGQVNLSSRLSNAYINLYSNPTITFITTCTGFESDTLIETIGVFENLDTLTGEYSQDLIKYIYLVPESLN